MVGGTNYYIESLLWKVLVTSQAQYKHVKWTTDNPESNEDDETGAPAATEPQTKDSADQPTTSGGKDEARIENITLEHLLKMSALEMVNVAEVELHRHLKDVDPATAVRLHPNNRRKVIR